MRTIHLEIANMRCRRCVRQATALLRDLPGVTSVAADKNTGRVTVTGNVVQDSLLAVFQSTSFDVRIQIDPGLE